jgi:dGTPase
MYTPNTTGDRSEFQRDRDRVLYTEAFRRLSGVSQVAYTGETEMYHDRLSHSLKVAQVGRRIAEYLDDEANEYDVNLNANVVETAALAHDIGHPPFGHPAERELDELLKSKGITEGFEGNAQSLRVLSHVAVHPETETQRQNPNTNLATEEQEISNGETPVQEREKPPQEPNNDSSESGSGESRSDPRGLNLTRASLNATIKYPWKRSAESGSKNKWGEDESEKFGRYSSECDVFSWVREGYDSKRRCLEAEIMDWADDLVYAVHDVEDFYRADVIPLEQILRPKTSERRTFIDDYLPEEDKKHKFNSREEVEDWLSTISDYCGIDRGFTGTRDDRMRLNDLASWLIGRFVGDDDANHSICINPEPEIGERYLSVDNQLRKEVSVLKFMLIKYVLDNPSLQAQRRGERRVIEDLFEILYKSVSSQSDESVDIIHHPFRAEAKELEGNGSSTERARLVTDIITSMTEQQAIRLHKRLTGDTPGSLQEYIVN